MEAINIFEQAVRKKLRFAHKGYISVEDLWDLPLQQLDLIFQKCNADLKNIKEESLLEEKSNSDTILELQVEIIRYIVNVKIQEQKDREGKTLRAERKQKLLSIIADKQDTELKEMSLEDLTKMVTEL